MLPVLVQLKKIHPMEAIRYFPNVETERIREKILRRNLILETPEL
jgi:hypothetical protein